MQELSTTHEGAALRFDRRTVLKSAGALIGASVLSPDVKGGAFAEERTMNKQNDGALRTNMIGFMLAHEQFPVPALVELGVAAEQAGFDLLATSDHLQPWQSNENHCGEAWVTLGALGQRTSSIWMGTAVTCPTFRYNPAVVAEAFATLELLYPGRIFLGVGSGEALNEQAAVGSWPRWQERSERLIEATRIIREIWSGEQISQKGSYYDVNAKLYNPPPKPVPLLMAANGPKAMRRAGQYGDGLITDPETWKQHKSEFEDAAKRAGKDLPRMPVLAESFVVVGDKKDAQAPAELWRFLPKAFKSYYNIRDPWEIQRRAEAELPIEEIVSKWVVSTDPEAHAQKIHELFQSGVTIVNVHSGQMEQRKVIDFYGEQVLPRLRRQAGVSGDKVA